jgi:UPF0755 protein
MKLNRIITIIFTLFALGTAWGAWYVYKQIYGTISNEEVTFYIPKNASFDQVLDSLSDKGLIKNRTFFNFLAEKKNFNDHRVISGKYEIKPGSNLNELINMLRIGDQCPVKLMFNNIETVEELSLLVSETFEMDSQEFIDAIYDPEFLNKTGLNKDQVAVIFIPNTYEMFWSISGRGLRDRMWKEYKSFWNKNGRLDKAKAMNLSPLEVSVLASIVEKESFRKSELKTIAGLYLNRLKKGMKLQSDPTVIFALNRNNSNGRKVKRVLYKDLRTQSPYNTYAVTGLPPGPIGIPEIVAIDAVLNYKKHRYIYMCAKPDLSGYNNYAVTHSEHIANANAYQKAMNERKIMQ